MLTYLSLQNERDRNHQLLCKTQMLRINEARNTNRWRDLNFEEPEQWNYFSTKFVGCSSRNSRSRDSTPKPETTSYLGCVLDRSSHAFASQQSVSQELIIK